MGSDPYDVDVRTDPPLQADEATTLRAYLDYQRLTLRRKVRGVDAAGLAATVGASSMTLGGLLKHLTLVETSWLNRVLHDEAEGEPWDSIDWSQDPDWEWRTGATDPAEELFARYDQAVARANEGLERALAAGGPEQLSARGSRGTDEKFSLRWILVHLIEEYARHNGHADLLREAYDGEVGE